MAFCILLKGGKKNQTKSKNNSDYIERALEADVVCSQTRNNMASEAVHSVLTFTSNLDCKPGMSNRREMPKIWGFVLMWNSK